MKNHVNKYKSACEYFAQRAKTHMRKISTIRLICPWVRRIRLFITICGQKGYGNYYDYRY